MAQYRAGFYLNEIARLFDQNDLQERFRQLAAYLSVYEAECKSLPENPSQTEPLAAAAANIVNRGAPTKASQYIHEVFRKTFRQTHDWSAVFLTDNPDIEKLEQQIIKALHIIDPRITKETQTQDFQKNWDRFGHEHREEFFYHLVPEYLGAPFLQLLEQDLHIQTLLDYASAPGADIQQYKKGRTKERIDSTLDLYMQFPYLVEDKQGLVFEVRDARKEKLEQRNIDSMRDEAVAAAGWFQPFRYRTTDFSRINKKFRKLQPILESDFFDTISENYNYPLYNNEFGLHALQMALSPFAVARIQRMLLEFIHKGVLAFKQEHWKIAVIERDVPAAALALEDLLQMLSHLRFMKEGKRNLPEVTLDVYYTEAFAEAALSRQKEEGNYQFTLKRLPLKEFDSTTGYQMLMDVSVLLRRSVKTSVPDHNAEHFCRIRSIHSITSYRTFLTDRYLVYNHAENKEVKPDLKYFLQNIFNKEAFLPGQVELLQGILSNKNMLGILPPHGGKSIVQLLAALLQPAPSISIIPSSHLAVDQEMEQSADAIYIADKYSILNQAPEERQRIRRHFLSRRILLLYAFAGNYQNKYFRQLLSEAATHFGSPGYAFIDEVHCLSEWGHDFRPAYFNLAANINNYMRNKKDAEQAILGLTSAAGYTTMFDIMRALKIGREHVVDKSEISGNLKYNFFRVRNEDIFYNTPVNKALEKTALRKQLQLVQLLEEWYSTPAKARNSEKTLIICPRQEGLLGIHHPESNGIADKLRKHFQHLTIREFTGSYEHLHQQASVRTTEESLKNLIEARLRNAHIIIATEDMAIGINTPGINNIIYLNMPASVEKFVQINGRAIRRNKEGNIYLFYNDQIIQHDESAFGNLLMHSNQEERFNTTPDQYLNLQFLGRYFSSVKKEMTMVRELLYEITFPEDRAEDLIAEAIEHEYGVKVSLNYHPANNPYQLYVNHANKTFGYIDYRSYSIITDNATLDPALGTKILNFTQKEIERLMPEAENVFKWLQQAVHQEKIPGIKKIFEKITENEEASLSIHFRNKYLAKITAMLRKQISGSFSENQVRDIYLNASGPEDFTQKLQKIHSFNKLEYQKEDFINELQGHYHRVRERRDTFAAVRRLLIIGAIDDFTIDYHSRMFNLVISPKSKKNYMLRLSNFLAHYISPAKAESVFDEFDTYEGDTPLEKATGRLIRFVYNRTVPYHLRGIRRMAKLPEAAGSEEEQQNNMAVYLRFHSRALYANPFITPNLRTDTNDLEEAKYKTLLKYFKQAGDFKENWQHLMYSTEMLLREAPSNYVLKILNAYATMLLYTEDDERFFKAYDYLTEGAINMQRADNISYQDFMTKLNIIVKKLYEKDPGLQETVEPILNLKIHNEWLKSFNKRFLSDYEEKFRQLY